MATVELTLTVPLTVTEFGTFRVGGSRASLDSVVHNFKPGATPEQIVHSFPMLELAADLGGDKGDGTDGVIVWK